MPDPLIPQRETADALLAGGLIAAPAWVPALSSINEVLTTVTLVLGVILAWRACGASQGSAASARF